MDKTLKPEIRHELERTAELELGERSLLGGYIYFAGFLAFIIAIPFIKEHPKFSIFYGSLIFVTSLMRTYWASARHKLYAKTPVLWRNVLIFFILIHGILQGMFCAWVFLKYGVSAHSFFAMFITVAMSSGAISSYRSHLVVMRWHMACMLLPTMVLLCFLHNSLAYGLNFLLFLTYFFLLLQSDTHHKLYWAAITDNKLLQLRQKELDDARYVAEQANRAKSEFLAGLSHEIRTPMNAILGLTDALWHGSLDETARNQVGIIRRAGKALMALINDILDLSKIEAGRLELEQINFDVRELVQKTLEMMMVSVQEKGLTLTCVVAADIPEIIGDPYRLRQILINLISNSVKFTEHGGITVSVQKLRQEGRDIVLQCDIADTGVGIPPDKLAAIFESFTQVDSSTTRKYGGTGLGLTIAQQLARMMGGDIKVKSELGKGSVFSVIIKARTALYSSTYDRVDEKVMLENIQHMKPMNVLLVEDNEENQEVIRSYLIGLPVQLDIAVNGAQGVEQFKKKKYDLVYMDIRMPVMDGYEATRQIRQWEQAHAQGNQQPVSILAFTASIFEHENKKITDAGCTALLMKPVLREEFFSTLLRYRKGGSFER